MSSADTGDRISRGVRLVLGVLTLAAFAAGMAAAAPATDEARVIQQQVLPCFNAPPGATGPALITFTLDAAGGFAVAPAVAEKSPGAVNAAFAAAALRAVVQCSPFKSVSAQPVRMTFRPGAL
jgi:hypothetical protein